jgi:glycosyltransferase involved in cell wall biosynthesis
MNVKPVTAVIPALNEGKTIGNVVSALLKHLERVVVVNDGSTDETAQNANAAGAEVVTHAKPRGYDAAISAGINHAFATAAKVVITCDADGQHLLEDVLRVAEPVITERTTFSAGIRHQYNRRAEAIAGIFAKPIFGTRDPFCGLKCYHVSLYEKFGPFPANLNVGTLPLAWARISGIKPVFLPIESPRRNDTARFGKSLRTSAILLWNFTKTLSETTRSEIQTEK